MRRQCTVGYMYGDERHFIVERMYIYNLGRTMYLFVTQPCQPILNCLLLAKRARRVRGLSKNQLMYQFCSARVALRVCVYVCVSSPPTIRPSNEYASCDRFCEPSKTQTLISFLLTVKVTLSLELYVTSFSWHVLYIYTLFHPGMRSQVQKSACCPEA